MNDLMRRQELMRRVLEAVMELCGAHSHFVGVVVPETGDHTHVIYPLHTPYLKLLKEAVKMIEREQPEDRVTAVVDKPTKEDLH